MTSGAALAWAFAADWLYALRWQLRSLRRAALAQDYQRGRQDRLPVVLVPGVYESWRFLQPLVELLHGAGHPVHVLDVLGFNRGEVPAAAQAVRGFLAAAGLDRVAVVAHSKGGLVGKHLLVHDDDGRVDRLVAINTPFSGSGRARWLPLPTLRVFVPGSPLLRELAAARAVNARITSIYSAVDPVVPGGGALPGARNVRLEAVGHFRVLSDPRLQQAVLQALRCPAAELHR